MHSAANLHRPSIRHAGERLPQFAPTMLQPLTPYEVVSFAEVGPSSCCRRLGL